MHWRSRFMRYLDTKPNGEALKKCINEGPYKFSNVVIPAQLATDNSSKVPEQTDEIYSTVDAFKTAHDMWIAIERLQQVNEIRAEKIARNANPLALVAAAEQYPNTYYQAPQPHKSYAPQPKASPSTRSHATTKNKGKEIAKPITHPSESASKEDKCGYSSPRYVKDNKTGQFGNQRTVTIVGARETVGSQETKKAYYKIYRYHKEKMLLCKQAEKGVPLQAEQSDWLVDTDEEIDEQELEAHYSFMKKI
ncbi:hypothetical protein Tco_0328323 [Tanacetum coccineum]